MFVSGVGGTGKSFLIEIVRSQVNKIWEDSVNNGDIACAVAAPTGLAAYNAPINVLPRLPHVGKQGVKTGDYT